MRANTVETFWNKVNRNDPSGCWIWEGTLDSNGYGQYRLNGKVHQVHRLAYKLLIGPIPTGKILHHKCVNPRCVRAGEHVVPVTRRENTVIFATKPVAAQHVAQTHCKHGHAYDEQNTRIEIPRSRPHLRWRRCRACERLRVSGWERTRQKRGLFATATAADLLAEKVAALLPAGH